MLECSAEEGLSHIREKPVVHNGSLYDRRCYLRKDCRALKTSNHLLVALGVYIRGYDVLALRHQACDLDLLGYAPSALFERTAEIDIWKEIAKVGFVLQDWDGVVLDFEEELGASVHIL
jgi:hypothetical protein